MRVTAASATRKWWNYLKWRLNGSPPDTGVPDLGRWVRALESLDPPAGAGVPITVVLLDEQPDRAAASLEGQHHRAWEALVPSGVRLSSLTSDPRLTRVRATNPIDLLGAAADRTDERRVVLVHEGAVLTPNAVGWLATVPLDVGLVYGDHTVDTRRPRQVRLKPAWSPRLLEHTNYVGGVFAVSVPLLRQVLSSRRSTSFDAWSLLRAVAATGPRVAHLPVPLAVEPAARRSRGAASHEVRAVVESSVLPRVKVVIPTRDRLDLLEGAVAAVARASGVATELVIVDDGSVTPEMRRYLSALRDTGATVVRVDEPFNFSRLINVGARSGGAADYLLMLNNDIAAADDDWLAGLCRWLDDPEVVGVGPKLLFPDGRIQHAGMVMGLGGIAGHYALGELKVPADGPPDLPREVSCLTAACLLVRASDFAAVEGMDESLPVDHQDVDLCLRLRRQIGGVLVYDPSHHLTHIQMASRDPDTAGSEATIRRMREKWGAVLEEPDEFWNPHLNLTPPGGGLAPLPADPAAWQARVRPRLRGGSG